MTARLDGTDVNQQFITGASLPGMILVYRGYLYWTNLAPLRNGAGTIGRARLNGTGSTRSSSPALACRTA